MQPRIIRYSKFLESDFARCILWNDDFELMNFDTNLLAKIAHNKFDKLIFFGMGCSAIVADIIKGFLVDQDIPIRIEVINDYKIGYSLSKEDIENQNNIFIICSYSGRTQEPLTFYELLKSYQGNIICLTSGGKLFSKAQNDRIPIIQFKLRNPDMEYPLFHVPQFISILLKTFYDLGLIQSDYRNDLRNISNKLKQKNIEKNIHRIKLEANKLFDAEIILLASPKWYLVLLKLFKMHLNEIAMVSAHRNYINEFTNSEVASLSHPTKKKSIVILKGNKEDYMTLEKINIINKVFSEKISKNRNVGVVIFPIKGNNYFEEFYFSLFLFYHFTLTIALYANSNNRNLIYKTAKYLKD